MRRRVVITGVGSVTPMGHSVEEMWSKLKRGESGVGYTSIFDASNFPTRISAEVRGFDISRFGEEPARWKHRGRHTKFAAGAAKQAMADSGINGGIGDPTRFGVYLGSGEGQQDFAHFTSTMTAALQGDHFDLARFSRIGLEVLHPQAELEQEPNMPAG